MYLPLLLVMWQAKTLSSPSACSRARFRRPDISGSRPEYRGCADYSHDFDTALNLADT